MKKSMESMTKDELVALILWYEGRLKYARYLLSQFEEIKS